MIDIESEDNTFTERIIDETDSENNIIENNNFDKIKQSIIIKEQLKTNLDNKEKNRPPQQTKYNTRQFIILYNIIISIKLTTFYLL